MFFIRAGSIIAWVLIAIAALHLTGGLIIAFFVEDGEAMREASRRYLGEPTSGAAIDKGLKYFAGGVFMGLLVQIAKK